MKNKKYIYTQMDRLLRSKLVLAWLVIAVIIVIMHQLSVNIYNKWIDIPNAYSGVIGFDSSIYSSIYYLVMPLITGIIGISLISDGKYNNSEVFEISRGGKQIFIKSNIWVAFLFGGFLTALPIILDSLIAFSRVQFLYINNYYTNQVIDSGSSMFAIFLNHPFLFWIFYVVLLVFFAGIMTTLSFLAYEYTKKRAWSSISVFIVFIVEWILVTILGKSEFSPAIFLIPSQGYNADIYLSIIINIVIWSLSVIVLQKIVERSDEI